MKLEKHYKNEKHMNTEINTTVETISKKNVEKMFKDYDDRVVQDLRNVIIDLDSAYYGNIPTSFITSLRLLANLYKIYYKYVDHIDEAGTLSQIKSYQNGLIAITRQINQQLQNFGTDALSQIKIARLQAVSTNDQSQDAIADLIN